MNSLSQQRLPPGLCGHEMRQRAFAVLALFVLSLLAMAWPGVASAIQNCHDYTYYALTGEDGNMLSAGELRSRLAARGYTRYRYSASAAVGRVDEKQRYRPGDVLLFGDSHSGFVNTAGTIDHYFQNFVGNSLPRKSEVVDPRDLDYQKTFLKGWTVERILKEHRNYREDQIEIWRKREPDTVGFVESWGQVTKDVGQVSLAVRRAGSGKGAVSVQIVSRGGLPPFGTASAGVSYRLASDTLNWADGELGTRSVEVEILNSDAEPGDLGLMLGVAVRSGNARPDRWPETTLVINRAPARRDRDQMGGEISFVEDVVNAAPGDRQVRLIVTRDGFSKGEVTVEYQSQAGSARPGIDYTSVAGKLTWAESDTAIRSIDVPIVAGSGVGAAASFTVTLANPSGGAQIVRPATVTVNLQRAAPAAPGQALAGGSRPGTAAGGTSERSPPAAAQQAERKDCRHLRLSPDAVQIGPGRQLGFSAIAVFSDGSETDVTGLASWQPGPANTYSAPLEVRFNERVIVTALWDHCEGRATVDLQAPAWTPPLSHADDRRPGQPGTEPWRPTWYVLCDRSGRVVYGEDTSPALFGIIDGPFMGPRRAEQWIRENCPRTVCTIEGTRGLCAREPPVAATGGDNTYHALCDPTGRVVISRSSSLPGHALMSPALVGETGARWWIEQNCPSWTCTSGGACSRAGAIRTGGRWAVVCSRQHGGVGFTEYPNLVDSWVWVEHLLSDGDARNWIARNCPGERCDRNGRCLPGNQAAALAAQQQPVEVPAGTVLELYGQRESSRQGAGTGNLGPYWGPGGRFSSDTLRQQMARDPQAQPAVRDGDGRTDSVEGHCSSDSACAAGYRCEAGHCLPATASDGQQQGGATPGNATGRSGSVSSPAPGATTAASATTAIKPAASGSLPAATPAGIYEPKGTGQPCLQVGQQMEARCRQMSEDCNRRNCSGGGYSGCAVDCPGCGGYFGNYIAWCTLHPSYQARVTAGLTSFVAEIGTCITQFLGDGKPGRRERGGECQRRAQRKLDEGRDAWVQQTCQARCAEDGRKGVAVLGGARHRCECR